MKRVASLYLPHWSIDRVLRAERRHAPPPETRPLDLLPLKAATDAERAVACDAPKNTGWRPGAKWARAEVERQIEALPVHQRPPMRELGRRSEAAPHPFRPMRPDEGARPVPTVLPDRASERPVAPSPFDGLDPAADDRAAEAIARWNTMPAIRYPGEGPRPDKHARRGSNDPHAAPPGVTAFFDTGRTTAGTLARVCPEQGARAPGIMRGEDARPIVTVQKTGSRIEIAAASPAAAALGLTPGMALTQARASVPDLIVHDADPAGDRTDLERLATVLARRWCPVVAISDDDGLFLDLTGVAHLHGGEERMARRIVRLLARSGVRARVAVADTTGAAWAFARHLSRKSGDVVRLMGAGEHLPHLAPLPVAALRLDTPATDLLARLGVDTIGELLALPRAPLVRRFGRAIVRRLDQATGAAAEPLDPIVPPAAIIVERRFAEPIATADAIGHWLSGLVTDLTVELAKAGKGARAIIFAAERVDSTIQTLRIGLARPTRDAPHILRLIARRIEEVDPGYGIDALALHVRRADPLGAEPFGAQLAEDQAPDLAPLVDTLANRIGPARLWRHGPIESDVPERSVAALPPLDAPDRDAPALRLHDVRRLDDRTADHPWHPRWPRPARLLRRPEQIDHVMAELPDYPPARFTWRGVTHRIVRGDGPERITGEWWRRAAERDAVRDYFQVEDDAGRRFWLFRRGDGMRAETGDLTWFMHGAFG